MPPPTLVTPEFDTIATKVKEYLEAITNNPLVYLRQRRDHFWDDLLRNQTIAGQLNAWEITLLSMFEAIPTEGGGSGNIPLRQRDYNVLVTGRLAFRDGTDEDNSTSQFNAAIESLSTCIMADPFLHGESDTNTLLKPITQVSTPVNTFEKYGSVLVHYCEMRFTAVVRKQGGYVAS